MEKEILLLKSVSELVLDLFTIEELVKKGVKPIDFEWKFNLKNVNLIPILELYDCEGKTIETFESIEFPDLLQKLLKEIQLLSNYTDPELDKYFLNYLEETTVDCSKCEFRDMCFLRKN